MPPAVFKANITATFSPTPSLPFKHTLPSQNNKHNSVINASAMADMYLPTRVLALTAE